MSGTEGAEYCVSCGRAVTRDEKALTRKLINRGATSFYCLTCLSILFEVPEDTLRDKIVQFKKMGCTLFTGSPF